MAVYALWNNKGGVGKSYLTFQIACEYARTHRDQKVLVVDLCPQANASSMILGGMVAGEAAIENLSGRNYPPPFFGAQIGLRRVISVRPLARESNL